MSEGVEFFAEHREACGATWRNFVIWASVAEPTLEITQKWADKFLEQVQSCSHGVTLVIIVRENSPMPPQEVRSLIVRTIKDLGSDLQCWAVVIEGSGFFASMARSVMAGMIALARRNFRTKTMSEVDAAAPWLAEHASGPDGARYSTEEIQFALNEVRVRAEMLLETGEI
ncbi:MAG: hypothetical protein AAF799_24085 [Myxococcota bacterium]